MKFINLTPHKIVYDDGTTVREFEPSGDVLRLEYVTYAGVEKIFIDGLQIFEYQNDQELTDECWDLIDEYTTNALISSEEIIYIVSNPIAKFLKSRFFIAPDTNPGYTLRDTFGNIVGVKRFCQYV